MKFEQFPQQPSQEPVTPEIQEEAEKRVSEFYKPIPEQVEANSGDEREGTNEVETIQPTNFRRREGSGEKILEEMEAQDMPPESLSRFRDAIKRAEGELRAISRERKLKDLREAANVGRGMSDSSFSIFMDNVENAINIKVADDREQKLKDLFEEARRAASDKTKLDSSPVTPEIQEAVTEDNQLDILISLERTGDSEKLDSLLREAINELRKTNPTLAERLAYERIGVYG